MKQLKIIPNSQAKTIMALGRYHYLTRQQLEGLGIAGRSGLYAALRDLGAGKCPLVGKRDLGVIPRAGRLPHLYFLTPRGAKLLAKTLDCPLDSIRYPKKAVMFTHDFQHRVNSIDCNIALNKWAGYSGGNIEFVDTYFTHPKTVIIPPNDDCLIPDMVAMINTQPDRISDKHRYLIAFEIYNQTRTGRVVQQLQKHAAVIRSGALNDAYGFTQRSYRLVCVFDTEGNMKLVQKRLVGMNGYREIAKAIRFVTLADSRKEGRLSVHLNHPSLSEGRNVSVC